MIKHRVIGMAFVLLGVAVMAIIPEEFPAVRAWEITHPPAHTICLALGLLLVVVGIAIGTWAPADKASREATDCNGESCSSKS